jgi:predicted dienelactone hydrolase
MSLLINKRAVRALLVLMLLSGAAAAKATEVGLIEIPATQEGDGPVTLFYPSRSARQPAAVQRMGQSLPLVWGGEPLRGNGRLIVISHGSGGSPWVHAGMAQALVRAGFVVAVPEHLHDSYRDDSTPGPRSWRRRPAEVSRAIDAVAADARFGPLLTLDKVGMYGMSAGGHTALTLAGGRWSPAQYRRHCEAHIEDDFQTCAGITFQLTGGWWDGLKERLVLWHARWFMQDESWYQHNDPRIAAVVAGVPFAADFDVASLASPKVPLGLVTARQDVWLQPRFHSDPVLQACQPRCEWLMDVADGGHGALLSPPPPMPSDTLTALIGDPVGFDRAHQVPAMEAKVVGFFQRQLLALPVQQAEATAKRSSPGS